MSRLIVVSYDPGVTTGWAVHVVECSVLLAKGQLGALPSTWWSSGQFRTDSTSETVDHALAIARAAYEKASREGDVFSIVSERFSLRMMSMDPQLLEPVRVNAVLEDRLREAGMSVALQTPADAKKTITDQRLKLWGLWKPGQEHARDAQRHGLLYLRRWATDPRLRKEFES